MSSTTVLNKQTRFDWLSEHSPFFAAQIQKASEQDISNILALSVDHPDALPNQLQPWVPVVDHNQSIDEALASLRQAKNLGIAYFLWWELGLHGDIEESARHLALWASGLIQTSLEMAKILITPRFGKLEQGQGQFVVLGLGKLGGWELNLGSDVDLVFVWNAEHKAVTSGGRKDIPAKEYYQHLSRLLIRLMGEQTFDGMTWLTDMRLRPNGDGAPICLNLQATLNHYQDHGQTWERAMLSKASVVAGDAELGEKVIQGLRPFIWRQYMDYTTVQALSEMKQRIDKQSGHNPIDVGFDVKRDQGGIREIEFMIQSLQLLYAGRNPDLAVTPSMDALTKLQESDHIPANHALILRNAYRFWRRVEHAIQGQRGMHTHQLPQDWEDWLNQALASQDIKAEMTHHSSQVHALFQEHFSNIAEKTEHQTSWVIQNKTQLLATILPLFPNVSRDTQQQMVNELQRIQLQLQRTQLPDRSHEQIESLTTYCLQHWQGDANALTALQAWADLLHHIGGRATWIDLLANNEDALLWMANMLASSGFIAKNIANNPTWLEWPLSSQSKEERITHICQQIAALETSENDEEHFLSNLGRLVDESRLTTAISIASDDNFSPLTAGRWLSDVADETVLAVMRLALFQYQLPADFPMVALALGKHGSQTMGLVSDLDMVFILVHKDPFELGPKGKNHREWAQRVGRRMIQHLSLKPPYGAGFDFDARLRPSGSAGVLVTTLQAFHEYQLNEAQTWEHQALSRARALSFSEDTIKQVNQVKADVLRHPWDENALKADVKSMRQKMADHLGSKSQHVLNLKHDEGGLVDIEFLAQYAHLYFDVDEVSTVKMLQCLPEQAQENWKKYAPFLVDSFIMYRQMENALRVHLWASVGRLPADDQATEWETLRRHAPIKSVKTLQQHMLKVRKIFNELLG